MVGRFSVPSPIEAKLEANVVTSITVKEIMPKISDAMSGRFKNKIMRLESKSIPMQTCHGGNPQMIRVGVELRGIENPDDFFDEWPWDINAEVRIYNL